MTAVTDKCSRPAERCVDEHELEAAARLQRALLPPPDTTAHGWSAAYRYTPAGPVGGDIVDLIAVNDRQYFLVADVSGKGVAASMLTGYIQAICRSLISVGLPLEEIVRRASALLCASTLPAQYATLVLGYVTRDGDVAVANAGHPPPLVVGRNEQRSLVPTGAAAGLFCNSEFGTTRLRLEPGESLVIYTDGLTEAFDEQETEYGVERLMQALAATGSRDPRGLLDAIASSHGAFLRGRRPGDDLTILVLRRSPVLTGN